MNFPTNVKYTNEHEWIRLEGDEAYVGITDYAQEQLGDIVFVDVTTEGETLEKGEVFGTIEVVKTVSDLFLPIGGEVLEINPELEEHPELVKEFFNFVTTTESLQEILDNSPVFTNLDVLDENLEQHWLPEEEEFMASLTEEQMKTPVLQTGTKYTNDFWNQFGQDLVAYCQGTIKDADEILKNMDKNRAEAAKTAKDPNWQ